jgi:uncharacterized protein YqgC (DUF456 family)
MDFIIIIIVLILLIIGFVGSFFPLIPGPPVSYLALLLFYFCIPNELGQNTIIMLGIIVVVVFFLDYWLQVYGVEKFGGNKKARNGTIIGLILGVILPIPFGILFGPFVGAYIGAKMEQEDNEPFKIAFGAVLGFITGSFLKLSLVFYIAYYIADAYYPKC